MEYLGDTIEEELSMRHAAKQGVHDAVSTGVRLLFLGGVAAMAASVILKEKHVKNIVDRLTR